MPQYKRRIKLIKPRFQNQLTLIFLALSTLGLVMQFILFHSTLGSLASSLPSDGAIVVEQMNGRVLKVLGITLFAILPLTYITGVLATFRIAGPLYRVEKYLAEIAEGGYTGPCQTRKGDQLQNLVDVLNEATLRMADKQKASASDSEKAAA